MELSMAVLDTEPHVSSLMDDLRLFNKRRAVTRAEYADRETWDDAVAKAAMEKKEHYARQNNLEKRSDNLRRNQTKAAYITDLVYKEQQAQEEKKSQTRKARELEAKAKRLSEQLQDMNVDNAPLNCLKEITEERQKRIALQEQLDETRKLTKKLKNNSINQKKQR